jgi:IS30 family transposase
LFNPSSIAWIAVTDILAKSVFFGRYQRTLDNGSEHSRWRSVERYGGVKIFFA